MDQRLQQKIDEIETALEFLTGKEGVYLALEAHKKVMLAQILLREEGKSFAEREARAYASKDWVNFISGLVTAEVEFNFAKRDYELALKAYDGEHLTYKVENNSIQRGI